MFGEISLMKIMQWIINMEISSVHHASKINWNACDRGLGREKISWSKPVEWWTAGAAAWSGRGARQTGAGKGGSWEKNSLEKG